MPAYMHRVFTIGGDPADVEYEVSPTEDGRSWEVDGIEVDGLPLTWHDFYWGKLIENLNADETADSEAMERLREAGDFAPTRIDATGDTVEVRDV